MWYGMRRVWEIACKVSDVKLEREAARVDTGEFLVNRNARPGIVDLKLSAGWWCLSPGAGVLYKWYWVVGV